jgi:small nuclear ribonucleoprotein (snRNP)-like protein
MWLDLPSKKKPPIVTVELMDGRKIAGVLRACTTTTEENREILLNRPLVAQAGPQAKAVPLNEDFVVLREDKIRVVSGVYIGGGPQT